MPRKNSTKSNPTNASEAMEMIVATEPLKTVDEAAEFVGVADVRLLEMFSDALNLPEAMGWELIPQEHEHLLNEFKANIENVQALPDSSEPVLDSKEELVEPPILQQEEEPKQEKKRKKKQSTALTQKKTEAIQDNRQSATQTQAGLSETLNILQAQEGAQDGANAGTAYLHSLVSNLTNIKGQGLTVIAAETLQNISNKSNFNPNEVLQKIGVPLSSETLQNLNETMGQVLGKAQMATEEMTDTAWGNGYNAQEELTRISKLMNLSD